jgi:carbamoyl-phosphate synthase large subunit
VENPDIDQLLVRIAKGLNLVGSINVQLRLTSKGPIVFEINPRFSSTVFFRHLMGFDDVIWSLQQARHMQISAYVAPKGKVRFFRVAGEVVIGM